MMKALVPVVMAGIVGVYGLVVSVLIANDLDPSRDYSLFAGIVHLASGLSTGDLILIVRICRDWSWICYWSCRRCWSSKLFSSAKAFCGNGSNFNFC